MPKKGFKYDNTPLVIRPHIYCVCDRPQMSKNDDGLPWCMKCGRLTRERIVR